MPDLKSARPLSSLDPRAMMDVRRLGAMHQSRLSFARTFVRLVSANGWQIDRQKWDLDQNGFGVCTYRLKTAKNVYYLVLFPDYIADEERSDRVVAEKWDVTFALVAGEIDDATIQELKAAVPLQEKGRNSNRTLVLSRANKSVRLFEHIVDSLASGRQPSIELLDQVGYILRTTAVYGNGKFGVQDFSNLADNEDFSLSFLAQMCVLYILRQFSFDWVNFLAKQRNPKKAVTLCDDYKRYLGIGNATGLGMACFLINHPQIINNWFQVRRSALIEALSVPATERAKADLLKLLKRASLHLKRIYTINDHQKTLNARASGEIDEMVASINLTPTDEISWVNFVESNQNYSFEAQEAAISCLLELYPKVVDRFQDDMNARTPTDSLIGVTVGHLRSLIETEYRWATAVDFSKSDNHYWFWYISENKEEPRLGVRNKDHGDELELPLDIARQVYRLYGLLQGASADSPLTDVLIRNPEFTTIARRTWVLGNCEMGEIRCNSLAKSFLPTDLLRCKLAMLGATKFDPRSDRWVQVTFFQNTPLIGDVEGDNSLFALAPNAA